MTKPERTPWVHAPLHWPHRGVPGGWRDVWEQDDEVTTALARAQRFAEETEQVRAKWSAQPKPTIPRSPRGAPEPSADPDAAASPGAPDRPPLMERA